MNVAAVTAESGFFSSFAEALTKTRKRIALRAIVAACIVSMTSMAFAMELVRPISIFWTNNWVGNKTFSTKVEACVAGGPVITAWDATRSGLVHFFYQLSSQEAEGYGPYGSWGKILPTNTGPGDSCEYAHYVPSGAIAPTSETGILNPSNWTCPANASPTAFSNAFLGDSYCICNTNFVANVEKSACLKPNPPVPESNDALSEDGMCMGNPIAPASQEKIRFETDIEGSGPAALSFQRLYRSNWGLDGTRDSSPLGKAWVHNHSFKIQLSSIGAVEAAVVINPEGHIQRFTRTTGSSSWSTAYSADALQTGAAGALIYRRAADESTFRFDADGKLISRITRNGWATSYFYDASGKLTSISNPFQRSLTLGYTSSGLLASVTDTNNHAISYSYDSSGRFAAVTYPDTKTRTFLYENTVFPLALTGIVDESGIRWATFAYDEQGRALSTELAGGVEKYQMDYGSGGALGSAAIIDPLGTRRGYKYTTDAASENKTNLHVVSAGWAPASSDVNPIGYRQNDRNGLIVMESSFQNVTKDVVWDVARRLRTKETKAANRAADSQTTDILWHTDFRLPVLVTQQGASTAFTYDSFGNTLSRTVTDASSNKVQKWQWTYDARQLISTETEPNGAVTSYAYDARGNLVSATNAVGHVTGYSYDAADRLLIITWPSGLTTTYAYDQRDRVLSQSVGGQSTVLTYKPFGSVQSVALPTGLIITYTFDAAQRLSGWSNNRGESGSFTLDGMGNRINEQVQDSAGNLAWVIIRTFNNINRLASLTVGPNQSESFLYNTDGDLSRATNGLGEKTTYELDGLRRLKALTDATGAVATFKYNTLDGVVEAKDFKSLSTTYVRDAQGNAKTESSIDIGTATAQYDALGLPSQITDALGQVTTISRDLLGRPINLVFADGKTTTLRYDLTNNSKGYLSEIVDRSGITEYTRDVFGRVTLKKQTLANGSVQQVSYGYNPNGTLASIGYPNNGGLLTYVYDGTGRLTSLNLNGVPIVTGITWNPLSNPTAWTWSSTSPSVAGSRVYDTAGRLVSSEFSGYSYNAAGRIVSLTQDLYHPGDADPTHSTISNTTVAWSAGYNAVGRVTSFNTTGKTASFGYDANGNRSSSTTVIDGQNTTRSYWAGGGANRLSGFAQTINGTSGASVTYVYNANGALVSDGLRSYVYDAEGRLAAATTGATDVSPTTRYAHNALGQRVFKTEPLYPPVQGDESDPGFMQSLIAFFKKLWSPTTSQAEQLGYAYVYDEQGTLIAEVGSGGQNSAGQAQYIYLPTANGPMPIAAIVNGSTFAVHSDHLNTPRKLSNASGQVVWQWSYSAFGEDKPTLAKNRFANLEVTPNPGTTGVSEVKFNLRYPGQYADDESGLFYNYFRSYDARTGRYSQPDPIGLDGGWNRFGYVGANPLSYVDPYGLAVNCETVVNLGVVAVQKCTEDGKTPGEQDAKDAKRMSGKQLDKACRANGYEDAHAMKKDLGLDSKSDIFVDKNGNLYSGPRQGTGTPQYLHMNSSGITPAPSPAPPGP